MKSFFVTLLVVLWTNISIMAQETPVTVDVNGISILFPNWKLDRDYYEVRQNADTIFVYAEVGETPEGEAFEINGDIKAVKVTQHFRTSLSISDEGPHLDLLDWKHHIGNPIVLKKSNGYFNMIKYAPAERERFPSYTERELTDYIKTNFPDWTKLLYDNRKFTKTALYHAISDIYLTIFYTDEQSSNIQTKIIVFHLPLGC